MITLIRPILFSFVNSDKVKRLIVDLLKKLAEQTKPAANSAATPVRQSRSEYIEGLRREGMSQAQIDRIMPGIDAFWAENGGWPK